MLSSLVFVVSALLEFAFVVLLSRLPGRPNKNIPGGITGQEGYSNVSRLFKRRIAIKELSTFNRMEMEKEIIQDPKNIKVFPDMPPIYIVDLYAFCTYIFLFISFNVIYWIRYYV